jgi:hypothetical protein
MTNLIFACTCSVDRFQILTLLSLIVEHFNKKALLSLRHRYELCDGYLTVYIIIILLITYDLNEIRNAIGRKYTNAKWEKLNLKQHFKKYKGNAALLHHNCKARQVRDKLAFLSYYINLFRFYKINVGLKRIIGLCVSQ